MMANALTCRVVPKILGPLEEYDERVHSRRLRDDEHQRCMAPTIQQRYKSLADRNEAIVEHLQDLHDMLADYYPDKAIHPDPKLLQPSVKSVFGSFFGGKKGRRAIGDIPASLPKGLYMYGDVGSGKTMLMDLFFDTL